MRLFKRKLSAKQKAALNALADGIECGAKLRPQAVGSLVREIRNEPFSTCALGAALECIWVKQGKTLNDETFEVFRRTQHEIILGNYGITLQQQDRLLEQKIAVRDNHENQITIDNDANLAGLIWQLNDRAHWSREQIAQFLREVE